MNTDNYDVKEWIRFAKMDNDSAAALSERLRPPMVVIQKICSQQ
jgi:hypothetical protein